MQHNTANAGAMINEKASQTNIRVVTRLVPFPICHCPGGLGFDHQRAGAVCQLEVSRCCRHLGRFKQADSPGTIMTLLQEQQNGKVVRKLLVTKSDGYIRMFGTSKSDWMNVKDREPAKGTPGRPEVRRNQPLLGLYD